MIEVTFLKSGEDWLGYEFSGHSDYAEEGRDIVCAYVSAMAYLTANYITDGFEIEADVTVSDGYMKLRADRSDVLNRLLWVMRQNMLQLEEQYEKDINVTISEV